MPINFRGTSDSVSGTLPGFIPNSIKELAVGTISVPDSTETTIVSYINTTGFDQIISNVSMSGNPGKYTIRVDTVIKETIRTSKYGHDKTFDPPYRLGVGETFDIRAFQTSGNSLTFNGTIYGG